ncbi:competence protein ComE [Bacillaceae bacterium SIJ1]|uniref:deoxycytidylate deaminase n=1 Tax=Litoribacterium kuwaitense TaxID=1398745 RepID=UPI0013EE2F10|nr:deaminase [Litoribacterium kuwaitense]NGP46004.1 competence protein ComE [Litoribacterium kuwaitense]
MIMDLALRASKHSDCQKLKVGAVLVNKRDERTFGSNKRASSICKAIEKCEVGGHCRQTLHAEMKCLITAAREGISTRDALLYVTHYPCPDCLKAIRAAGIRKIYYKHEYPHSFPNNFADGMTIIKVGDSDAVNATKTGA